VRANLDDLAPLHADDAGPGADGRKAMCNDDDREAAHDCAHVLLDNPLAVVVKRRSRLVENENTRIGRERAGDRDALARPPDRFAPRSSIIVS